MIKMVDPYYNNPSKDSITQRRLPMSEEALISLLISTNSMVELVGSYSYNVEAAEKLADLIINTELVT